MADVDQSASGLLALPVELIFSILTYLEPLDLSKTAESCQSLKAQTYDDKLWQPLVNRNLPEPLHHPAPCKTFRELYIAHHGHWHISRHQVWYADSEPSGKLLLSRFDPRRGCIEAYTVAAARSKHTLEFWEKDPAVIIHSFNPIISLDLNQPVLKLDIDSPRTDDQPNSYPSDRGYDRSSIYSKEILMETFAEAGLYSSFMLCRSLPQNAIGENSRVWPPLRIPADSRTRNASSDGYNSSGHRPTRLSEVSQHHFRLRKWVEYTGRRSSPSMMSFTSPNSISAALGISGPYFHAPMTSTSRINVRMPEDITTYGNLPDWAYKPTPQKPWQGVWCGDYSGHGCEFLVVVQPDEADQRPLPGMQWLQEWFKGRRSDSDASSDTFSSAQEEFDHNGRAEQVEGFDDDSDEPLEDVDIPQQHVPFPISAEAATDYADAPTGRLEAIKLTGDLNIPRGEVTFVAPDIGHGGFIRVADEEIFRGARVVKSAGHIAGRGFREDQYTPSQLIMISHDRLAQFWESFGHISYYQRVDIDALLKVGL